MPRYGDRDWQVGDVDPVYVKRLQGDLKALGFDIVGKVDGHFGRKTFWAVREFQIHAAGPNAGVLDAGGVPLHARLKAAPNPDPYAGPIHGRADAETRRHLAAWLQADWRCPLLITAFDLNADGSKRRVRAENLWLHDDLPVNSSRVAAYAYDVSGRHAAMPKDADGAVPLGRYTKFLGYDGQMNRPPRHVDPNSEITPERLTGSAFSDLTAAGQATFRVVRAVSEVECMGFFDSLNTYDNAIASMGPAHWTLGIVHRNQAGVGQASDGELSATLAYFRHAYPAAASALLEAHGVRPSKPWTSPNGRPDGGPCFIRSQRKYAAWMALDDGGGAWPAVGRAEADANYFKAWPWVYRWIAAARTDADFRTCMWDMARVRLRDLAAVPTPVAGVDWPLGAVFRSEKAMALLLRWHIRYPAYVVNGDAGVDVRRIVKHAMAQSVAGGWPEDPGLWRDVHEAALVRACLHVAKRRAQDLQDTLAYVDAWPQWVSGSNPRRYRLQDGLAPLSEARGSFTLDAGGLPPAP